jgi:transposase
LNNQDLLRLDGFKTIGTEKAGDGLIVDIELLPPAKIERCDCPPMTEIRKHGKRAVCFKDFPIQRQSVTLRIKRQRWRCQGCGKIKLEQLPGFDGYRNMTTRFRNQLAIDAIGRTFTDAANMHSVKETLVRRVFAEYSAERLAGYVPPMPRVLGMDEKFINGRARFVIGDVEARTMLDLLPSRKTEVLEAYFHTLRDRQNVEVITQDMYWAYKEVNERYFRNAMIVIDKFHVVRYANSAVEIVRKAIQGLLDNEGRINMKRRIPLLGARPATLNDERKAELKKLLKDYPTLDMVVQYKELFFEMYECKTRTEAEKHFEAWAAMLPKEMEKPFAVILRIMKEKRWKPLILNYFDHPYTNAYIEGLNGLMDQINRTGRGYNLETLRAKALLRYGDVNRLDPRWDPEIVAEQGSAFLDTMYPLHSGHGIDLATFEHDLAAGAF